MNLFKRLLSGSSASSPDSIQNELKLSRDLSFDAIGLQVQRHLADIANRKADVISHLEQNLRRDQQQSDRRAVDSWLSIPRNRSLAVQIAFLIAILVACVLAWTLTGREEFLISEWLKPNTVLSALVPLIVATPVAYLLWFFRDQNAQWQIENQRKDVNLKDFHKLAEWVSGQHLLEEKWTTTARHSTKSTGENSESLSETQSATESYKLPSNAMGASKRSGGESLQVAAVYQLGAFLEGEFGRHFERPAFHLLTSLWAGLNAEQTNAARDLFRNWNEDTKDTPEERNVKAWSKDLNAVRQTPLGQALNRVLTARSGLHLHRHARDLAGMPLTGASWVEVGEESLSLTGLKFNGSWLEGAVMYHCHLEGADFSFTRMAQASLWGARLEGANFYRAVLDGAELFDAKLSGAEMTETSMRGASASMTDLRGATLLGAKLNGTDLSYAELAGADLRGALIDSSTELKNAKFDRHTRFGRLTDAAGFNSPYGDYIDADQEKSRWIAAGATQVDGPGD